MNRNPKVHTALICIGEGAEATWWVSSAWCNTVAVLMSRPLCHSGSRRTCLDAATGWRTQRAFLRSSGVSCRLWSTTDVVHRIITSSVLHLPILDINFSLHLAERQPSKRSDVPLHCRGLYLTQFVKPLLSMS